MQVNFTSLRIPWAKTEVVDMFCFLFFFFFWRNLRFETNMENLYVQKNLQQNLSTKWYSSCELIREEKDSLQTKEYILGFETITENLKVKGDFSCIVFFLHLIGTLLWLVYKVHIKVIGEQFHCGSVCCLSLLSFSCQQRTWTFLVKLDL